MGKKHLLLLLLMFMSGIISSQTLTLEPIPFIGYGTRVNRISEMSDKDYIILLHESSELLDDIVITTSKVREKRENVAYQIQSLNTSLQYKSYPLLTLQVVVNNILDLHYRTFASGISAPGRNVIISIKTQF